MKAIDNYLVGKNIERVMHLKKISQEKLGKKVGCYGSVISTYVCGKFSPKATRVQEIAAALEVDVRELFKPMEEWDDEDKAAVSVGYKL